MRRSHPSGWSEGRVPFAALLAALWIVVNAAATAAASPELIDRPITRVEIECDARIDEEGLRELLPLRVGAPLTEQGTQ